MRQVSKKKQRDNYRERKIRQQLATRANGRCEICGKLPDFTGLHPHEKLSRARGGKMSLENSVMVCMSCHQKADHNDVRLEWFS